MAKQVKFVLHEPRTALWQFRASYHDDKGEQKTLVIKTDPNTGREIHAVIRFPAGRRMISIPENKKDMNGNSFAEFIENSPYCKGSPTCEGSGIFFKYDPQRDAKIANEEKKERLKAELYAAELQKEELKAIAGFLGCFDPDVDVQESIVGEYARLQYRDFNEKVGTPEVTNTAIFKSALNKDVIRKRGFMYEADLNGKRIQLGNSDEKAISTIASDENLRTAIVEIVESKK